MKKCKCIKCKRARLDEEEMLLREYGWYVHMNKSDKQPFGVDIHTHGFAYKFHPDIQICFPIDPKFAHNLFEFIYSEISKGKKFKPNQIYRNIMGDEFDVCFIQINENLIRLIFPDESNNLSPNKMKCPFKHQFEH